MNIIGFSASPRKEGNTAWIVNQILDGAKEEGADTQYWSCSDLDITPCRGCLGCHTGERDRGCVINDDMQQLYDALAQADALVLGSPIYMGQMSGQAKIFTDRLFAQITPRFSPHFNEAHAGKKLILVFSQGNPDAGMFQVYIDYTKQMFQLLEFDVQEVVVVAGMRSEAARERRELHAGLKEIGSLLVSGGLPKR